jgi:hypothetical protein
MGEWARRRGFWGWRTLDFEDEDDDEYEDDNGRPLGYRLLVIRA